MLDNNLLSAGSMAVPYVVTLVVLLAAVSRVYNRDTENNIDNNTHTGDNSTHDEKYAAAQEVTRLLGCRGKAKKTIIDGSPFDHSEIAGVAATFIF